MKKKIISNGWLAMILIAAILIIDQVIKIEVKTNMCLGEKIRITDWFYIFFIENNGMAYGMQFISKLFLTCFRLVAVTIIAFYIASQVKKNVRTGYIVCLAMVLAGAAGNIIDCVFYGQIFTESTPSEVAHLVPFGEGYQDLLKGRVVDMLYFPLISFTWPDWVPLVGGSDYLFFSPIFNFADSCITVGVILILLFYRKELNTINFGFNKEEVSDAAAEGADVSDASSSDASGASSADYRQEEDYDDSSETSPFEGLEKSAEKIEEMTAKVIDAADNALDGNEPTNAATEALDKSTK